MEAKEKSWISKLLVTSLIAALVLGVMPVSADSNQTVDKSIMDISKSRADEYIISRVGSECFNKYINFEDITYSTKYVNKPHEQIEEYINYCNVKYSFKIPEKEFVHESIEVHLDKNGNVLEQFGIPSSPSECEFSIDKEKALEIIKSAGADINNIKQIDFRWWPSFNTYVWYITKGVPYAGVPGRASAVLAIIDANSGEMLINGIEVKEIEVIKEKPSKEKATLRVKAYDAKTGEVVRDATTIVLKYSGSWSEPVRKLMTEPTEPAMEEEVIEVEEEPKEWVAYSRPKIVVGTIRADSTDSIELKSGTYELITYAKDYVLHTHYGIDIKAGQEYILHAPLSKDLLKPIPEETIPEEKPTKLITVKTGKLVKMVPEVGETEVEVIPTAKFREVSIRQAEEIGKSSLESGKVKATTSEEIEIEDGKLYAETNETKKQIKVLPATASERAREAVKMHKIKDIELVIVDEKPVYAVNGEQNAKLLGFIPTIKNITVEISGEDGQVTKITKPWWSSLAIANK